MIEIQNLTKIYKKQTVLNDVNLRLEMGKIYGLVGVNGSGKTTSTPANAASISMYPQTILIYALHSCLGCDTTISRNSAHILGRKKSGVSTIKMVSSIKTTLYKITPCGPYPNKPHSRILHVMVSQNKKIGTIDKRHD